MSELKFREVNDRYKTVFKEDFPTDIKIKPYYTLVEKRIIHNDMMSTIDKEGNTIPRDAFGRDFSLIVLTATYCTNIDFTNMSDNDIYDTVAENLLIEQFKIEIDEYLDMYKLIEREESTYKLINTFLDVISKKLDGFDMNKIQEGFVGLKEVLPNGRL